MIELVAVAFACLGTVLTGVSTAWLWVEHFRMERRLDKLEADFLLLERRHSWPPGVARGAAGLTQPLHCIPAMVTPTAVTEQPKAW